MKKKIIIFNGMHSAGKTALATALAKNDHFSYHYEIGKKLRHEVDYLSLTSFDEYDMEIMRRELKRDQEILNTSDIPVIETWHVGDMAYAMERSPKVIPLWKEQFRKTLTSFDPLCILIQINDETFRKRAVKGEVMEDFEEMLAFYKRIIKDTVQLYHEFKIPYIEIHNDGDFEQTLLEANNKLKALGFSTAFV